MIRSTEERTYDGSDYDAGKIYLPQHTIKKHYDLQGRLVAIDIAKDNRRQEYSYDHLGNLIEERYYRNGKQTDMVRHEFLYDNKGRLLQKVEKGYYSSTRKYVYDDHNNLIALYLNDVLFEIYEYEYDFLGNITEERWYTPYWKIFDEYHEEIKNPDFQSLYKNNIPIFIEKDDKNSIDYTQAGVLFKRICYDDKKEISTQFDLQWGGYSNILFEKDENHIDVVEKGMKKELQECIFRNWKGLREERCYTDRKSIIVEIFDRNFSNEIFERKKGGYWGKVQFFDYLDLCRNVNMFQHNKYDYYISAYSMRCFLSWKYDTKGNWIERKEYKNFYTEGSVSLAEKEEIVERKIEYY